MVNNYVTKQTQQILIVSLMGSVILTQILNVIAKSMFQGYSEWKLLEILLTGAFYLIIVLFLCLVFMKSLFWFFKIESAQKLR
jgi:hypothetical protein